MEESALTLLALLLKHAPYGEPDCAPRALNLFRPHPGFETRGLVSSFPKHTCCECCEKGMGETTLFLYQSTHTFTCNPRSGLLRFASPVYILFIGSITYSVNEPCVVQFSLCMLLAVGLNAGLLNSV